MNYDTINNLTLVCDCTEIKKSEWDQLMQGARRANKRKINALVKKHLPDLYYKLALNYRNPYNYFKTDKHLVLVHSSIEYFIAYA